VKEEGESFEKKLVAIDAVACGAILRDRSGCKHRRTRTFNYVEGQAQWFPLKKRFSALSSVFQCLLGSAARSWILAGTGMV
jgi:hypothetical protein